MRRELTDWTPLMMTPQPPNVGSSTKLDRADVAAVIINYGTADLALQAVDSVLTRDHCGLRVEVHLVDNASPGDDAAWLACALEAPSRAGRVTFYPEMTNHGFGRGNNMVLQALADRLRPPHFVFLLNPDARLKTNTIAELATFLDDHPQAAAVGAGIDLPDGTARTAAFRFPSAISEFAGRLSFGPISRLFDRWSVALPPEGSSRPVDWVAGAAVMFRYDALASEGGFDPAFFLYYEEVELMHRLHRRGWHIWYQPASRVEHVEGAATGVASKARRQSPLPEYWFDSWRLYFLKTKGRFRAILIALAALIGTGLHALLCYLRGRAPSYPPGFPRDFLRGCLVPLIRMRETT